MKFKLHLIFTLISLNLTSKTETDHLDVVYYSINESNTIHIDILKNSSGDLKNSLTHKFSQTSSELDNFLDSHDLNKPSTSFEFYEFVDMPRVKMVTLYVEHNGTKELNHNTCEGLSCPNNMEFDYEYTKKFKWDDSLKVDKEGRFMDWNATDLNDFVENKNIIEILSHNTQKVSVVSKQKKGNFRDGLKDTKMKGSENSFINDTFRFGHDESELRM